MTETYIGMNPSTGQALTGIDHLRESVSDIVTTPVGSMITLREYGCVNFALIDQPATKALRLQIIAATVMALLRWEPRAKPARVELTSDNGSGWEYDITMVRQEGPQAGQAFQVTVPMR